MRFDGPSSRRSLLTIVAFVWCCSGCDNGDCVVRVPVHGQLTLDGAPLAPAAVVFDNEAHAISLSADVDATGAYVMKTHDSVGLPLGEYRVAVRPPASGKQSIEALKKMVDDTRVPKKYHNVKTSGLKYTVVEGDNNFDIELKPK